MRRLNRWTIPVTLALLATGLTARAEPSTPFRLEARLPASTMAFASLEDVSSWKARFEQTALGRLLMDEEMQAFLRPLAASVEEMAAGMVGQAPPMVKELVGQIGNLRGQVALSLVGMDASGRAPVLAMGMDFGDRLGDFTAFLGKMQQEFDPQGTKVRTTERDGRTSWEMDLDGEMTVYASHVDTAFLAATDEALLSAMLRGPAQASLATDPEFQGLRARLGGDALGILVYGSVRSAVQAFAGQMSAKDRRMADALGLDTVAGIGYGLSFQGDGFRDSLVVHAPGADHGILALMEMPPLGEPRTLDLAPAKTFLWEEGAIPFADLLPRVRSLVGSVDADAVEQMDEGLAQLAQTLGVDLQKDLLSGLAGPYGFHAALPDSGGLYPEVALVLEVKDPAGYERVFERLAQGIAGVVNEEGDVACSTRTMEYRGARLHLFEMQAAHGKDIVPFTPTWAILGNRLVVTLVPHAMKEIVIRAAAPGRVPGLAAKEDFRTLWEQKPADAGDMAYVDLKSLLSLLYDTGVPLLQTIAKKNVMEEVPLALDWALLPPSSRVVAHFRSMAAYSTWNRDGIAVSLQAPMPMLPMVAVAVGAAAYLATSGGKAEVRFGPAVEMEPPFAVPEPGMREPPKDLDAEMDRELARIQAEMLIEAADFFRLEKGRWPTSLAEVVEAGFMGAVPKDPWDGDYRLKTGEDGQTIVESAGPDQSFGTSDDVRAAK